MFLLHRTIVSSVKNPESAEVHARMHAKRKLLKEKLEMEKTH